MADRKLHDEDEEAKVPATMRHLARKSTGSVKKETTEAVESGASRASVVAPTLASDNAETTTTTTTSTNTSNHTTRTAPPPPFEVWTLPPEILFHVLCFTAPPTLRAAVCCHQLAVLCQRAKQVLLCESSIRVAHSSTSPSQLHQQQHTLHQSSSIACCASATSLWETILQGDYGVNRSTTSIGRTRDGRRATATTTRRSCKRLKRSPVERVRDAHGECVATILAVKSRVSGLEYE